MTQEFWSGLYSLPLKDNKEMSAKATYILETLIFSSLQPSKIAALEELCTKWARRNSFQEIKPQFESCLFNTLFRNVWVTFKVCLQNRGSHTLQVNSFGIWRSLRLQDMCLFVWVWVTHLSSAEGQEATTLVKRKPFVVLPWCPGKKGEPVDVATAAH